MSSLKKRAWISYLPEIYQEEQSDTSFLARYLGIFQSLYESMTEQIEELPGFLEPSVREPENLAGLADWFSIEKKELWNDEQLLYLVQHAVDIRDSRGTVACLKELVRLYAGREPYVVEYHQLRPYFDGKAREALLKRLYAKSRWEFAVLVCGEELAQTDRFLVLKQIVDMAKPAHMESRIIILHPYIFLDHHSYLGVNSVLGKYRPLRLDGQCAVPFSVIGNGESL